MEPSLNSKRLHSAEQEQLRSPSEAADRFYRKRYRNGSSHDDVLQLEAELRRAYVTKGLLAQIEGRRADRHAEEMRERQTAALTQQQQRIVLEEDQCRRSESLRRAEEYRLQLDEQLMHKEQEKRMLNEEDRRYRESLEEMDRLQEEQERTRTAERKRELAESMREEKLILERIVEKRRREEREAEEEKRLRDSEYLWDLRDRLREVSRLRQEQKERRERVLLEVTRMILDMETRREEKRELFIELIAEEVRGELVVNERQRELLRRKMQRDLATGLQEQIAVTRRCKLQCLEEDREWAESIMRRIMEDEKMARATAEARRRMKTRYRDDLQALMEQRRRIRDEEIAKIEMAAREERTLRRIEAECIKEERRHLLEGHASNIADVFNRAALNADEQQLLAELSLT